jgi:hypothetical protein
MKIKTFFTSIFISLFLSFIFLLPVLAQTTESPQSNGNINPPVSQCGDGFDNDTDGKIDKTGLKTADKTYEADPQCVGNAKCEDGTKNCEPCVSGSGFCINIKIKNPLKVESIQGAIGLFMSAILRIAIPFIVIFFIWSGLNFVLARGNPEAIKKAKNMFWYTIIGTLLILGAWTITNIIIGTVNSVTS